MPYTLHTMLSKVQSRKFFSAKLRIRTLWPMVGLTAVLPCVCGIHGSPHDIDRHDTRPARYCRSFKVRKHNIVSTSDAADPTFRLSPDYLSNGVRFNLFHWIFSLDFGQIISLLEILQWRMINRLQRNIG